MELNRYRILLSFFDFFDVSLCLFIFRLEREARNADRAAEREERRALRRQARRAAAGLISDERKLYAPSDADRRREGAAKEDEKSDESDDDEEEEEEEENEVEDLEEEEEEEGDDDDDADESTGLEGQYLSDAEAFDNVVSLVEGMNPLFYNRFRRDNQLFALMYRYCGVLGD
jgi:cobalamin biosynthesis protein CobT